MRECIHLIYTAFLKTSSPKPFDTRKTACYGWVGVGFEVWEGKGAWIVRELVSC